MLILAEGTIHRPLAGADRLANAAWLGPMVDSGFLQSGWVDAAGRRLWLVISAPDIADAEQRLKDLPVVREGAVTFTVTHVTAVRFT